ncbi:MAG TPA: SRPBCC family protein [Gillisia sp.]|nr:SRPBCC family protein [Gillisia sp.]
MMETQNEKGGSQGSQRAKGSTAAKGQGKMNQGTETAAGRSETSTATKIQSRPRATNEGDGMLSGVNKNQVLTALGVVAGGALLYKGAKALTGSGKGRAYDKKAIVDINTTLKVRRPKEELYAYWRNLENLPNFMSHIEDVRELSDKKSEWTAEVPGGLGTIEWEAEIIWEQKDHSIAWRSLPDSEIENSGEVRFQDAGNGKSTIVEARISYRPPAGQAGGLAAKLLNPAFKKVIENDLKEFKKVMEDGGTRRSNAYDRM